MVVVNFRTNYKLMLIKKQADYRISFLDPEGEISLPLMPFFRIALSTDHRLKQLTQLPHLNTVLFSNRFERRVIFCLNPFLAECELQ